MKAEIFAKVVEVLTERLNVAEWRYEAAEKENLKLRAENERLSKAYKEQLKAKGADNE